MRVSKVFLPSFVKLKAISKSPNESKVPLIKSFIWLCDFPVT